MTEPPDEAAEVKLANKMIAEALAITDWREMLCRNAKPCPACGTDQVQLVDYIAKPARWKCRHCKHRFTHEPAETQT